jgi:uncharacterized protein (DUF1778 family)
MDLNAHDPGQGAAAPHRRDGVLNRTAKLRIAQLLKKNFVVEQALLYFMAARRELPDEALVPARLVLEDKAFDRIVESVTTPPAPTPALRELMGGRDG